MCGGIKMNSIYIGKKKYKIVDKKKFTRFMFFTGITVILIMVLIFARRNMAYSSIYENQYIEVVIIEGDTLWDIAKVNMPENYDTRKMVFEIKEFNNMKSSYIYPGELIKVPIK